MVISELQIAIIVLATVAGIGLGVAAALVFILKRRKILKLKKLAFDVSRVAHDEGLDLLDEILESVATADLVELIQELHGLHKIATAPGGFRAHLDKVFTKQLGLRLADATRAVEIFKAVDDARAAKEAIEKAIVQKAKDAEKLAAAA